MDDSVGGTTGRGPAAAQATRLSRPTGRPEAAGLALSVVIDGRSDPATAAQVARLAARLQLAGVWIRHPPLTGAPVADLGALLTSLGAASAPGRAGLIADADHAGPGLLGLMRASGSGLPGRQPVTDPADPGGPADPLRLAVCGAGARVEQWLRRLEDAREPADAGLAGLAVPAAVPAAVAGSSAAGAVFVPLSAGRELGPAVAGAAQVAAGRPVLVEVAVSVGRTAAEASARADGEELFTATGHPRRQGLFGTLEECQADAARLAHAGATELVCHLPRSHDLPDVLAQLRAISVGAGVLRPGDPPSSPPPPPVGWGGRRPQAS